MGRTKISEQSREVTQSYVITSARYNFSVYEKRILYRIIELTQAELRKQPIGKGVKIEPTLYNDQYITMPLRHFLKDGEQDKNHYRIKEAFKKLQGKIIEEDTTEHFSSYQVIGKCKISKNHESVRFMIYEELYRNLLDFSKGYNQYELWTAFNFRSQYTMRLYELVSKCGRPAITYSIERLKAIFCLEGNYKKPKDFFKRVIDPVQKELEESKAPYYFTYEKIKVGRAFKNIKFNVHYRPGLEPAKNLQKQISMRWDVDKSFTQLLNDNLGTEDKNWKPHRELLKGAQYIHYDEVKKILRLAQNANNRIGYVVNAFKKQLNKNSKETLIGNRKKDVEKVILKTLGRFKKV